MESRITKKFKELKSNNQKALITYITCGDPDLDTTIDLVLAMEKAGADIIELGIPYSDPLADGPTIQRASQRALNSGTNIDSIFEMLSKLRKNTDIPIAFLLYYNSIFAYGIEEFLNKFSGSVDGLIIPDLPLEERKELQELLENHPIDLIPLVAPTSEDRIKEIVKATDGFIYCISSLGVTGKREKFNLDLKYFINKIKNHTDTPTAIGFGISNEKNVKTLKDFADGLIVGSTIVEKIEESIQTNNNVIKNVYEFVNRLKEAF
ncbi:tryptophan synthase subunit alpha [Paramaledivibacter caminithermalis]|jgi:tryptophan synthase alpha chain|uniref:Tryptophan synthase alpha chain n=1 Tax=Paramaledivibacter caminithermalis (strain DSM 15212 / CIP 107654 / DViRD3) TaxID=1121301 RepID=A0A1M6RJ84_PARC5|nr:tryptophan synthase subunit alpha [Paramaledivibacter caminithermalis]SHK32489.1 tryptophan synthase, alpha chain [Paramaledivibacter caminithermalis DSM 15212]